MKLYALSGDPAKPCYVLSLKDLLIMLDCGLSVSSVLNFLPLPLVQSAKFQSMPNWNCRDAEIQLEDGEIKECCGCAFVNSAPEFVPPLDKIINFSEIDVILISNYTNMLALPFITEGTGFTGTVYATEPTLQIGRFFLEELVEYIEASPKESTARMWKDIQHLLPPPLNDVFKPKNWRHLFSMEAVNKSLARVQMTGYDQKLDIFGALQVTPVSSGFCLGSSNWIIAAGQEKISYISGSSTLTTHPRPINQAALKYSDVVIMTGLTQAPHVNPDGMLGELCMNVVMTLRNGGSVLIPCYPSGVVYDLFECLSSSLDNQGFAQIPMFFISPVADSSLAYSNILAEWLSTSKQNKVYIPDEPFPHASLVKNAKLKHFKHIYSEGFSTEFRQPCVVFCGHPSLRFGDAVHFLELWGSNPLHTIIFTEPDFPYLQALAPYQPLSIKTVYCPIETSLNFQQANKLIKELKPGVLVIPENYTQPPPIAPHKIDLVIDQIPDKMIIKFKRGEVIKLPLKRKRSRIYLDPQIARSLVPHEVQPGVSITTLTGVLQVKDNIHDLHPLEPTAEELEAEQKSAKAPHLLPPNQTRYRNVKYEWGTLDVNLFLKKLAQDGISDIKVEQGGVDEITLHLPGEDTMIKVSEKCTSIVTGGKLSLRLKLRDLLLQCVQNF
ncbi:integrator complex subunit 9 [Uranotaenia lowii]|uniref:integrator complex subunit 9 n=1 Tax=Uranotaenia lowii TaxID=190385 RepID=UPI002479CDBD|nr:integrator complex subunit 9 [Uranotaenia lowii]